MPLNSFDSYPLTWKPELSKLSPPYYLALAEDLEGRIRRGELKEGTKLPPQREIADFLDLNYTTITRVYEICRRKGLIYGTVGKGTFVAPHAAEDVTTSFSDGENVIELGAINSFSEYSELTEDATRAVIEKGYLRNLYEYSHPTGHPHQRAAGVRWMEQLGVSADAEHTAIFSGAQNALTVSLLSLFSPGDRIAVDTYTYSNFIELARLLHLSLVAVAGDAEGMLPEELSRQCAAARVRGVYLIPSCGNPTAVTIPEGRRRALAEVIRKEGLILIEDDIASWLLAAEGRRIPSLFDLLSGDSVYICGMTKSLCAGLRIAFSAFGERFRAALIHGLVNANLKTSSLDAEIITELILSGGAYRIAEKKRAWTERNVRLYGEIFPEAGAGERTYYKWLPIRMAKSGREVEAELLSRGVRVYHSDRFRAAGAAEGAFLRVSLSSAGNTARLARGLRILRSYLEENHAL